VIFLLPVMHAGFSSLTGTGMYGLHAIDGSLANGCTQATPYGQSSATPADLGSCGRV
jgi:hypothetical protein